MANYRDDKIRAKMGEKKIILTDLAERIGITRQTLAPIVNGTAEGPKTSTLELIARELDIPWAEMFEPRAERVEA